MVLYMCHPKDQQTKATSSIIVANNLGMLLGFITAILYKKIGMQMICLLSVISGIVSALFISLLPKEKT